MGPDSPLDTAESDEIRRVIQYVRPHLIVNAAAYTAVDRAETDETTARAVNAEAPARIAEEAKKIGASLVHYSTDYVFDGLKDSPYDETDPPKPINVYGRTKLAGEQAVREVGVPHLIFRTAWIYSTRGRNFLLTILRLATQREELRVVSDQIGAPTWSWEIASATSTILAKAYAQERGLNSLAQVSGTYHMTAAGEASWYQFAKAILEEASAISPRTLWFESATDGRPLSTHRIIPIPTAEYPTSAARPAYSVLSNALLSKTFGYQLSGWRQQLHLAFSSHID